MCPPHSPVRRGSDQQGRELRIEEIRFPSREGPIHARSVQEGSPVGFRLVVTGGEFEGIHDSFAVGIGGGQPQCVGGTEFQPAELNCGLSSWDCLQGNLAGRPLIEVR